MIRLFLIILSLLYLAIPARAQVVQVRSGEHENFSRLTINLPDRLDWSVEPNNEGARVVFSNAGLQLDTSVIFDRIPRARLSNATWNESRRSLDLRFDCACVVTGFWHGSSMLVLDVQDDKVGRSETTPAPLGNAPLTLPQKETSRAAGLFLAEVSNAFGPLDAPTGLSTQSNIEEARDRLLVQFSRAASQGLITPSDTISSRIEPVSRGSGVKAVPEAQPPNIPQPVQINLRAQSSIDQSFNELLTSSEQQILTTGCLPPQLVDVSSWGDDTPFSGQLSALRLRLSGEFDKTDLSVAADLAKLYLFFGFGAEAASILQMFPDTSREKAVLQEIATIAEDGFSSPNPHLASQMDCASPAALWSALSYETLPRDSAMDIDSILLAFNGLPVHLRSQYGPTLVRRFLDAGQTEVATKLLRILDRPNEPSTPETELVKAHAERLDGNVEDADERFDRVIKGNSMLSPEALIELIEDRVKRGETVSFEQAQLAAAYAFEEQGSPLEPLLTAAHIRALAASGAFDQSFAFFVEQQNTLENEERTPLRSDIIDMLTKSADNMTFLRHAFAGNADSTTNIRPNVANAAAQRLLDLGFTEQAARIIESEAPRNSAAARVRQLLHAEIALSRDRPRQAIVELLDLDGKDANLLRARALSAVGEHDAAFDLYAASDQPDRARDEAWLQGDWANAGGTDEPVFSALADDMTDGLEETTVTQNELAEKRALLSQSGETREILRALLAQSSIADLDAPEP